MSKPLFEPEGSALATVPSAQITPMTLIEMAASRGASIEQMAQLFELKLRVEADEARKAYSQAFSAFKAESVRIVKNISVTDGPLKGKKYADLFAVSDTLGTVLSKHGLSASWKITRDEPAWIEVTCNLRHELGHSEAAVMGGPPDTGGAKNAIQARASTVSYLERYTLLAVTGMAATAMDTDGRPPSSGPEMPEQQYIAHMDNIQGAHTQDELLRVFTAAYKDAKGAGDKDAMDAFIKAKDNRKGEIR